MQILCIWETFTVLRIFLASCCFGWEPFLLFIEQSHISISRSVFSYQDPVFMKRSLWSSTPEERWSSGCHPNLGLKTQDQAPVSQPSQELLASYWIISTMLPVSELLCWTDNNRLFAIWLANTKSHGNVASAWIDEQNTLDGGVMSNTAMAILGLLQL